MRPPKPITIVGGGLAGLTLGIGLRREGIPVTVWEAGRYPRHRVCGEFISGRGQDTLARLGLAEKLDEAGAIPAQTVAFLSLRLKSQVRKLARPAISVSRYALDALLAEELRRLGGELRENERWRGNKFAEGMVRATGRRVQPVAEGWRWFGLKVHARNVTLCADLEMHLSPEGYVGISRLRDGEVNVCGLFRRAAGGREAAQESGDAEKFGAAGRLKAELRTLCGAAGTLRHERLAGAVFDENSLCSVAGLSLEPQRAEEVSDCCIGDGITMIPPVTGNGMSMAFESAELAVGPLVDYSRGAAGWEDARRIIARRCDVQFARRLAWARGLQRLLFMTSLQDALVTWVPRWERVWRLLVNRMR